MERVAKWRNREEGRCLVRMDAGGPFASALVIGGMSLDLPDKS